LCVCFLHRSHMTDLFLLDDPLSAVDVEVGNIMFHEGVCDVLSNKTRVIVMNSHLHLLQFADEIIILDRGKVVLQSDYDTIMSNEEYAHLLPKEKKHRRRKKKRKIRIQPMTRDAGPSGDSGPVFQSSGLAKRLHRQASKPAPKLDRRTTYGDLLTKEQKVRRRDAGRQMREEDRETGAVRANIYTQYLSNAASDFNYSDPNGGGHSEASCFGVSVIVLEICILILAQMCQSGSDVWLSLWSEEDTENRFPGKSDGWWLMIWSFVVVGLGMSEVGCEWNEVAACILHFTVVCSVCA